MAQPYEPAPPYRRSRSSTTSRLSSGLEAVEHLAHSAEYVAEEVETAARVGKRLLDDWDDDAAAGDRNADKPVRGDERVGMSRPTTAKSLDTFRAALAEAQEFVDEMRDLIRKITTLRQNLTGTSYMRYHSYSAVAFSTKDMNYLESLTTTVRRQILVVYHAIQALKAEFPDYTSNGPIAELSERETALMKKELNHLYSTYADRLDTIEARAEVEEKEIEDGTSDKRFEKIIEDKEPGMQHEEILKQLKEARALQRSTNINKLQPSSFAHRLALEFPFIEINRSLDKIDRVENSARPGAESGFFGNAFAAIKHSFWHTRASATAPIESPSPASRPASQRQAQRRAAVVELEEGKRGKNHKGDDSDDDISDAELLGPDGQLPRHIPTDDPNGDKVTAADILADARHKRKLERYAYPFLIGEWVCIALLILYWCIARFALKMDNPLGNVDLGSHFGDDSWDDKEDGIPSLTSVETSSSSAATGGASAAAYAMTTEGGPSELMSLVASAQAALTAAPVRATDTPEAELM